MNVIILAAGEGRRLRPYTNNKPKCLVEIGGNTILSRSLSLYNFYEHNVSIVGGYYADQLINLGNKVLINKSYATTNMVASLFCAENLFTDGAIISYGDIAFSPKILDKISLSNGDICVAVDQNWMKYWSKRMQNPLEDLETLKINIKGEIIEIGDKAKNYKQIEGQYIGLIKLTKKGAYYLRKIYYKSKKVGFLNKKKIEEAYITDLLQEVINQGGKINSVPFKDPWIEVDTIADLVSVENKKRVKLIDLQISAIRSTNFTNNLIP